MKFEQLQKDMIAAMKEKNKARKDAISSLVSATKKLAIDEGCRDNITDDVVNRAVLKEMKLVKEQLDTCPDERADLKAAYQTTYDVIMEYAPSMMSAEEVKSYILTHFADAAASKNKGMIMKSVMPELKGKADGQVISDVVSELCK